jgi:hypothetical protein
VVRVVPEGRAATDLQAALAAGMVPADQEGLPEGAVAAVLGLRQNPSPRNKWG